MSEFALVQWLGNDRAAHGTMGSAFAIGPALAPYFLSWFGYQAGAEGMRIEQPQSAIIAIYIGAGLTPAALYGLSLIFLFRHDLSEDRLKALRRRSPGFIPGTSG